MVNQVRNFNYLGCQLGSSNISRINYKGFAIYAEQLNIHFAIKPTGNNTKILQRIGL
jgi:hypothetical protein